MAHVGYARISTKEQNTNLQNDALKKAECTKIFTDTITGSKAERKGLNEVFNYLRSGDTLVVWKLDRLGRSLKHLIETVTMLESKGIGFKSLTENMDTTTPGGKLVFHFFGAIAQFERDLIRERTNAGIAAARARGRIGGKRKSPLADPKKLALAKTMHKDKNIPIKDILAALGVKKSVFYKYIKQ